MTVGYHIHIVFLALICCRGLSIWNLVTQFKGDVRDVYWAYNFENRVKKPVVVSKILEKYGR